MADSISSLIDRVNIGPLKRDFQGNSTKIENIFWAMQKFIIGGLNIDDLVTDVDFEKEGQRLAAEFIFTFFRIDESVQDRLQGYAGVGRSKLEAEREKLTSYRNGLIQDFNISSNQTIQRLFGLREPFLVENEYSIKQAFLKKYAHLEHQSLPQLFSLHLSNESLSEVFTLPISIDRNVVISFHKQFKPVAKSYFKLQLLDDFLSSFEEDPHIPFIKTSEYLKKKEDRRQIYLSMLDPRDLS